MKVNKFFEELDLCTFSQLFTRQNFILLLDGHVITVKRSDRNTLVSLHGQNCTACDINANFVFSCICTFFHYLDLELLVDVKLHVSWYFVRLFLFCDMITDSSEADELCNLVM